ncbi:MAG TPA: hypothetical protein VJP77_04255 [Planctomycetota bacterium]|nr:hypothetical protein [Planctomycetota bacterium]
MRSSSRGCSRPLTRPKRSTVSVSEQRGPAWCTHGGRHLPQPAPPQTPGRRAVSPPEDCGGIPGYEDCVAIRRGLAVELDEEERLDREEWLVDWMPEEFDLEATRRRFDR